MLDGWTDGWMVGESKLKPTQPSLAGAWLSLAISVNSKQYLILSGNLDLDLDLFNFSNIVTWIYPKDKKYVLSRDISKLNLHTKTE